MERAKLLLREVFRKESFREPQSAVISDVLSGRDVLVLLPTGSGKSLCYQLPAVHSATGVTVVVSPLLALIENQIQALVKLGIAASSLNSNTPAATKRALLADLEGADPKCRLLFVTAEMMATEAMFSLIQRALRRGTMRRLIVDEAHCISEWGHGFRPDYRRLGRYKQAFPTLQICAFTATATKVVKVDIQRQLCLSSPAVHESSFNRANIRYRVISKFTEFSHDDCTVLLSEVRRLADRGWCCGIIYCHSRADCDRIAEKINAESCLPKAAAYHAGIATSKRTQFQSEWLSGRIQVIVATISFGMGVDHPNVRFVLHHTISRSLEAFYQESGRAGRDGSNSVSILLVCPDDQRKVVFLLRSDAEKSPAEGKALEKSMHSFEALVDYCSGKVCRRAALCGYFGERLGEDACAGTCDVCERGGRKRSYDPKSYDENTENGPAHSASESKHHSLPGGSPQISVAPKPRQFYPKGSSFVRSSQLLREKFVK